MTQRTQLPAGQQCESGFDDVEHSSDLRKVFKLGRGEACYNWLCGDCCDAMDLEPILAGDWPKGETGRFVEAYHCERILGLDDAG